MVVRPLFAQNRFTSSASSSFSLAYYLNQYKDDEVNYHKTVQEYFSTIPCLRTQLDVDNDEVFIIVKLKFLNIDQNSLNSKGFKNQILNMNIIHKDQANGNINIVRNKRDIVEPELRLGFKLPGVGTSGGGAHSKNGNFLAKRKQQEGAVAAEGAAAAAAAAPVQAQSGQSGHHSHELDICFENILIDRSKLLKSVKKEEEDEQFISRDIEIEILKFANFEEFQNLYNNFEKDAIDSLGAKLVQLQKLESIVESIIADELSQVEKEESIKRDFNEQIFANTLKYQIILMLSIVLFNAIYAYKIQKHLHKKI